jgi:hypothetical protein
MHMARWMPGGKFGTRRERFLTCFEYAGYAIKVTFVENEPPHAAFH